MRLPIKKRGLLLLYSSVNLLQHSFLFQLEGSVKAKGDELASKVEEQKKMQEDMEIKLLEEEKQLNKKFLDKQKEMELEMETQLKKAKEVDGDKDGRIASLEDQLEALKLNMKQVEKNADAAIKQQMQQHANKADKEIAIKNSVIASLKSKIEEIESSQKVTIADKGLVTLSIFQLEEMKYNLRQEASEKVTGIADKGLVTLSIFELEKMKYNLRQEGRVKLAFKTKVKEMREAIEKDAAIKQQMQQHANKADKDIAIKNSVIADLTTKLESSEKKTGVVDKGLVTLSIFELEEIKYNPRQEGRTKLVIKKIVKDMRETIQAQRDELESRDSAMSALSRKLANLEAQAFDQDHEFRQQKTRQISLKAEVVSLKSQLGDKCKELSKLRRVFLEERAAKRDQDTGMKKRNRIIHLKGNSINNQPKSEETEDQTKFTANSG